MRNLAFVVCLGTLLVLPAAAQSPETRAPPQFRAAVDLMRIETTVLDKRTRKPVRGLTAADFIIKVNGEVQSIEAMDEVAIAGREATRTEPFLEAARDVVSNNLKQPRLFVIVMDDALVAREGFARQKGKDIAHAVVASLGPTDLVSIVFAQHNQNAQDFTADRAALRRAIETYDPRPLDPIMGPIVSLSVLERSSAFLRRMPGYRRAIVWITLGPGGAAEVDDDSLTSWQLDPLPAINVTGNEAEQALLRATNRVLTGAVAAVPIYAYSTVGLKPVTANEIRGSRMPSLFGDPALDTLARSTGGRQIYNTNAPELEVPSMFAELSSYYAIAFRSSFPMDGKLRRLQVDVTRPDMLIILPDTTFATPKDLAAVSTASRASAPSGLVEALSGPLPRGDVRLSLGNVPVAVANGKDHAVALTVGIPSPVAGAAPQQFALSVFVYDGEGRRELLKQSNIVTVSPGTGDTPELSEVAIALALRPGRFLVRAVVAEAVTGTSGSVYTTVTVPDFSKEPLSVSGVAIGRAEGRPIGGREALTSMLPFAPTVAREFSASDHVGALIRVHQAAGRAGPVRLETEILDATNAVVAAASKTLESSVFATGAGVEHRYDLPLKLLAQGEYLLRFVATAGSHHVTRDVRFSIR